MTSTAVVSDPIAMPDDVRELFQQMIGSDHVPLYREISKGAMVEMMKAEAVSGTAMPSGEVACPLDRVALKTFLISNTHHSRCIKAKVAATVGLGFLDGQEKIEEHSQTAADPAAQQGMQLSVKKKFKESKADKALDPVCKHSFADLITSTVEDFFQTGDGYFEAIRDGIDGAVVGLYQVRSEKPMPFVEKDGSNYHFIIKDQNGIGSERRWARWGETKRCRDAGFASAGVGPVEGRIHEIIEFREPTSLNEWFGYPDWLRAVPVLELVSMLIQWKFDFFLNRGVPEFILAIMGAKAPKEDWDAIKAQLKANIGMGKSHKTMAINIGITGATLQVEKLAMETKGDDGFTSTWESSAVTIVTAHGVPPLLAGILIPGKLGGVNETPQSLQLFQIMYVGPKQRLIQRVLGKTLGSKEAGLGLTMEDFALAKITEEIDIGTMDTVARMRQSPQAAAAEGRDPSKGVKQ